MRLVRAVLATLAFLPAAAAPALEPCDPWQWVYPWPTASSLGGVAYGDGRFVAVGREALVSEDGVVWGSAQRLGPTGLEYLGDVVWTGDRFVAVGGGGYVPHVSPLVASSSDGSTWDVSRLEDVGALSGVACDGPACVAVGAEELGSGSALVYFSPDGEQWALVQSPGPRWLDSVARGGGAWVAAGDGILRSSDGLAWEVVRGGPVFDLDWEGSRCVALAADDVIASADGATWSHLGTFPAPLVAGFIASNGRQLLAGGWEPSAGQHLLAVSVDGAEWSSPVATAAALTDAVWVDGQWAVVGHRGLVGTSPDGLSWRWHGQGGAHSLSEVAWNGDEVMAVGSSYSWDRLEDSSAILVSADRVGWRDLSRPGQGLTDVHWSGERWVAVGYYGVVEASVDGREWESLQPVPDPAVTWRAAASSPTRLVAVGVRHSVEPFVAVMEQDGAWLYPTVSGAGSLEDVLWTGTQFVAVGSGVASGTTGMVGWSADGLAWAFTPTGSALVELAFDGRRLVAVGPAGTVLWSDDGRSWATAQTGTPIRFEEVTWAGDRFVAVAAAGGPWESADGETWAQVEDVPPRVVTGLAWTGRELLAVTWDGAIARRRCGETNLLPESAPRLVVPAAAHRGGAGGTAWRSDLHVVYPGEHWAEAWLGFVPPGADAPTWQRFLLPPGGQLDRGDLVARTFGLDAAVGQLLVVSEQPLAVSSRTFTSDGAGTWGQEVPALAEADLAAGATSVVVPMLRHDTAFRSNLGLVNAGDAPLTLEVELFDAAGTVLGSFSRDLGPLGWAQEDGVLATLGAAPVADAYAVVSADDPAARFAAYGSVVDNRTGDPTLVLGLAASTEELVVPAVAHGAGAAGTFWTSDLVVANPGGAPAAYRLELLAGETLLSPVFTLEPGSSRRHEDVVASVFVATGTAALRVVPTAGAVAAASRTSTPGDGGSYGQGVPAVVEDAPAERLVLAGLAESAAFRTNLGLVNPGEQDLQATVELYRGDGSLVGTLERVVPAASLLVLPRAFAVAGDRDVASGYAVVATATPGARLLAWSSVVDTASGDPVLAVGR